MSIFERMLGDLAHARARLGETLVGLATRGQRLDTLAQTAQHLDAESVEFQRRAIGVVDHRWPARLCRLCWFDVEFRHFVCAIIAGSALFITLVLTHWWIVSPL